MGRKLKTDYTEETPINISNVNPNQVNRLNSYCNLLDIDRKDFILDLVEKELQGLVLDNTEIKLAKPFYFNMKELKENGVVKATKDDPIYNREEVYFIERLPNNLDTFNKEARTFCYKDKPSLHRGITVITSLDYKNAKKFEDILKDTIYIYNYNSQEDTLEISLNNVTESLEKSLDMCLTLEHEELKARLLKENEEIYNLFKVLFYDKNGALKDSKAINDNDYRNFLDKTEYSQKKYFTSLKWIKEFKKVTVEGYKEAGVLENPKVKEYLDTLKEF